MIVLKNIISSPFGQENLTQAEQERIRAEERLKMTEEYEQKTNKYILATIGAFALISVATLLHYEIFWRKR